MNERLGIVEERAANRAKYAWKNYVAPQDRLPPDTKPSAPLKKFDTAGETRRHANIKPDVKGILNAVAEAFNVPLYAILGGSQSKKAYLPRHAAALLLRTYLKLSYPKTAVALGRSDHVTARNSVQKGALLLVTDTEWAERYHAARRALGLA